MRKFTAVLLVFAAVFSVVISGCGKAETKITESTTSTVTTTAAEVHTEETTISWEEANVLRAEKLVATKADFEKLENLVRNITLINLPDSDDEYDSTSDTAFQKAMYMMYNSGVHLSHGINGEEFVFECFGEYDEDAKKFVFEPDPLNRFADVEDAAGYIRINAEYVDWVLENVLCVTPDHGKTSDDFDYSSYPNPEKYYYYDGYYYYSCHEGGGGGGPLTTIGFKYNRDGSYTVKLTSFDRDYEEGYDVERGSYRGYEIYEVRASLKAIEGERVWAISYIRTVENVDHEG